MKNKLKLISVLMIPVLALSFFCSCGRKAEPGIAQSIEKVLINGEEAGTVEALSGAFSGVQGDMIEFRFSSPQKMNAVYVIEKTATVKQFNIYAEKDGDFELIYTGKEMVTQYCTFETVETSAIRVKIINTDIGKDGFIIQGIDFYYLADESEI